MKIRRTCNDIFHNYLCASNVNEDRLKAIQFLRGKFGGYDMYEAAKRFRLGYASEILLNKYDFPRVLVGRITIPFDTRRMTPLSGRDIIGNKPKYWHTPGVRSLYLVHNAIDTIVKCGYIIIVEGFFDAMLMHLAGFANTVASCGSVLSKIQCACIASVTRNALLLPDQDKAGRDAAFRNKKLLRVFGVESRIILNDTFDDPDDLVRSAGKEGVIQVLRPALTALGIIELAWICKEF